MKLSLTLPGAPRTKKSHPQLIMGRAVLLPSEFYTAWLKQQLESKLEIKALFGAAIPISNQVHISAQIYRDKNTGDWTGYVDAIADAIQSDCWQCQRPEKGSNACRKKMVVDQAPARCEFCNWPMPKRTRKGLGLILDDRQIVHWDGTRLLKDAVEPRIELTITVIAEAQPTLFEPAVE